MESERNIRIAIADDHRITGEGIVAMLKREREIEVIWLAYDGREAIELCRDMSPQVILMDVLMPNINGIEATRIISRENPGVHVIGLSMHTDKNSVTGMIEAGASGYLLKGCSFQELLRAIHAVVSGKTYLDPGIAAFIVQEYINELASENIFIPPNLTGRERELLRLVAIGMRTKDISKKLGVSAKTVETHRRQIMEKLGVFSIAELTKYAIKEELTPAWW